MRERRTTEGKRRKKLGKRVTVDEVEKFRKGGRESA